MASWSSERLKSSVFHSPFARLTICARPTIDNPLLNRLLNPARREMTAKFRIVFRSFTKFSSMTNADTQQLRPKEQRKIKRLKNNNYDHLNGAIHLFSQKIFVIQRRSFNLLICYRRIESIPTSNLETLLWKTLLGDFKWLSRRPATTNLSESFASRFAFQQKMEIWVLQIEHLEAGEHLKRMLFDQSHIQVLNNIHWTLRIVLVRVHCKLQRLFLVSWVCLKSSGAILDG